MDDPPEDPTLHLPRILCLHGGGTNAHIFRLQCRVLITHLRPHFRLCFAEGPFPSAPGPNVLPVYDGCGPFRRWFPGHPDGREGESRDTLKAIEQSLASAMDHDNLSGATGEWVGMLGFSQGAKLAASLLLLQQVRAEVLEREQAGYRFRFAVLMAGLATISLDPMLYAVPNGTDRLSGKTLHLPTIHVHGLQDPFLELNRRLLDQCCEKGSTILVEWNGDHRVPIKTQDVMSLVRAIMSIAIEKEDLRVVVNMQEL